MSIVMNMTWAGVTPQQYHALENAVGWRRKPPSGGRYHIAWFPEGKVRIVDVWESPDEFDRFLKNRLEGGVAKVGIAGEPQVDIWPLYDLQVEADPPKNCVVADDMDGDMPKELYQELERRLDWARKPPKGAFVHIVALDGDVMKDVGVWRSQAALESFVTGPLAQTARELGMDEDIPLAPVTELHAWFDPTKVRATT